MGYHARLFGTHKETHIVTVTAKERLNKLSNVHEILYEHHYHRMPWSAVTSFISIPYDE
jgi:hypothetical protein